MEFSDFRNGDCKQFDLDSEFFFGLWRATNEDPCTTGCAYYDGGSCPGYKRIDRGKPKPKPMFKLTNVECAKKLSVSKRQISKMRKAGTLEEALSKKAVETLTIL